MEQQPKIIVTMTSWKRRIHAVGFDIFYFLRTQTIQPDIFYLCLSEEEFPHRELSLPPELPGVCAALGVKIKWTPGNDFCFKRWSVYPQHYNDVVVSIDDDIKFPPTLLEHAYKHRGESNIIYNIFKDLTFRYKFIPNDTKDFNLQAKTSLQYRLLGCNITCPRTFPLEMMSDEMANLRRTICPRCDETWIKPFTIMHDTMIGYLPFNYDKSIVDAGMQTEATWQLLAANYDGFQIRDYQLYVNLTAIPGHLEKWLQVFPDYNNAFYESIGRNNIINKINSHQKDVLCQRNLSKT